MIQQFDENRNDLENIQSNKEKEVKDNEQTNNNQIISDSQCNVDENNSDVDSDIINQQNNKKEEQKQNNIEINVVHKYNKNIQKKGYIESDEYDDTDIDNKNLQQQLKQRLNQEKKNKKVTRDEKLYEQIQNQRKKNKLLENQILNFPECSLIQWLSGLDIDLEELEYHQNCFEIIECEYCSKQYTFCQQQSHMQQEHIEFYCLNCGLFDPKMTNQNHRLRCFQLHQFGLDDAKIQQLDSQELENNFTLNYD
ncbi:unnamed protein product [Paramecium pentaurelia]|uniref:Uncharacterized protein n=1 Tax=Paramecium pentaurelia TaxID=43138 RepID=A0A8S1UJH0_9CILI|nr:unnamed protein product [Paramecium pentaurelia]